MPLLETLIAFLAVSGPAIATQPTKEADVVIIGGGAAGSHAAVRLRDDFKKSIVLVEKEGILVRQGQNLSPPPQGSSR